MIISLKLKFRTQYRKYLNCSNPSLKLTVLTGFSCKLLQLNNCAGFGIGTTLSTLWEAFSSGLGLNFFGSCFIKIRLESFRLCRTFFYITNLNLILMLECHSIANLNLATFNQSMFGCKFILKLCIKCMIIRPIVIFLFNLSYFGFFDDPIWSLVKVHLFLFLF